MAAGLGSGDPAPEPVAPRVRSAADDGKVIREVYRSPHGDRAYRLDLPPADGSGDGSPLLVVLHGCTQDAEDVARGTRMDRLARERAAAVLYPEQAPEAHPMACWNWYEPAHQGRSSGEPAILAGMIRQVVEDRGLDGSRVHLVGISAGGAMAAVVAAAYPEMVAGLAAHSGIPFGAARGLAEGTAAMEGRIEREGDELARAFRDAMGEQARLFPLLVIHGEDDPFVSPRNVDAFEAQWRGLVRSLTGSDPVRRAEPAPEGAPWEGEVVELRDRSGTTWFRSYRVRPLGHAWSGGSPEGTFTPGRAGWTPAASSWTSC